MQNNDFKSRIKNFSMPEQKDINDKFMYLLDRYLENNSFENREFLCYLTSAIFLTYKKLYPQLSIYIPFRIKADISFIKNVKKELALYISNTNLNTTFDPTPIEKDISGIRIILNDINLSLPQTKESAMLFHNPEIHNLYVESANNFNFVDKVDDYIYSTIHNGKTYFELKKELLKRIIEITPPEFTEETKPNPSFSKLLEETENIYKYFIENDSLPTNMSDADITELETLANALRSRSQDPLQFAILRETLPVVFDAPLIKNVLKTSYKYDKESLKPSAFQSIYYNLDTPFGPIEVQCQSNKAYYAATKGSSYHSGLKGKTINIKDFFELVNPNDEHDISYYLDNLDATSADDMISPYELPEFKTPEERKEFMKTPMGIAYLESEKYREMIKHIKIKDEIEINSVGSKTTKKINANTYLFSSALALSPYMNVCSSGHTSFTNAGIHHKKIIGEFAEVLRKRDSNTCLRDLLIRRLEQLIEHPEDFDLDLSSYLQIIEQHDNMETHLPKDISQKNILSYAEKLRERETSIDEGTQIE